MAGRNYPPPPLQPRHPMEGPASVLEDRVAAQRMEIHVLLLDNQRLAATHVALKQDLSIAQQDLRRLSVAAAELKDQRDAEVREIFERSLKLEGEARAINTMAKELCQVRGDVQKLSAERMELEAQLRDLETQIAIAMAESEAAKSEIELLRQDIGKGRIAIELEKKTQHSNLEQSKVMERNMTALAHEIQKLSMELAAIHQDTTASTRAAGRDVEFGVGESPLPDPLVMHQVEYLAT